MFVKKEPIISFPHHIKGFKHAALSEAIKFKQAAKDPFYLHVLSYAGGRKTNVKNNLKIVKICTSIVYDFKKDFQAFTESF